MKWLAVLDMDGTLLKYRTIDILCKELKLTKNLRSIDEESKSVDAYEVSARVAQLFSGVRISRMRKIFSQIPLVDGAKEFVDFLKSRDFTTAIVTDSYVSLASSLAQKLGIDTVKGNTLRLNNGVATGEIIMPLGWVKEGQDVCQKKAICKLHAMNNLIREYSIKENRTLAVGDSQNDSCVIEKASIGVAFRPKDESITKVADIVIHTDFYELMSCLRNIFGFS